jgi:hypothetical protein
MGKVAKGVRAGFGSGRIPCPLRGGSERPWRLARQCSLIESASVAIFMNALDAYNN